MKKLLLILLFIPLISISQVDIMDIPDSCFHKGVIQVKYKANKKDAVLSKYKYNKIENSLKSNVLKNSNNIKTKRMKDAGFDRWVNIYVDEDVDLRKLVKEYKKNPNVEKASLVFKAFTLGFIPNDALYVDQWYLNNTGQDGGTSGRDMQMEEAWDLEKGDSRVKVALIDEGVSLTHPDLVSNLGDAFNFQDNSYGSYVDANHATNTAGILAAESNNTIGVSGVADITLYPYQVSGMSGIGGLYTPMASAFIYAGNNNIAITSNSWTIGIGSSQLIEEAIDYFIQYGGGDALNGGLVIVACGNSGAYEAYFPANYEPCISVASLTNTDTISPFSTYHSTVDISAAGGSGTRTGDISTTTWNSGVNNYTDLFYGTSAACPVVAGVAALIISYRYGELDARDVRWILENSTDDIYDVNPTYVGKLGSGRVNAYKALLMADSIADSKIVRKLILQTY